MWRTLRHRDFRLLWIGQSVSLVGDGITLVALAWLVYDIENSPGALSLVGFATFTPMVATVLIGGVITDRFERRKVLLAANLLRLVAVGGIASLTLADVVELWHVIALVVLYGAGNGLFQPAFTAIVPGVVPEEDLLQANALKEFVEPIGMRFAGPALGGVLITAFGVGTAFAIDAVTFVLCAATVALMERVEFQSESDGSLRSVWREFVEGVRYVRARPWIWATLVGASLALLFSFGPMEVLLPYIIRNDMGEDAGAFGLVLAAGGIGSIVAAAVVSRLGMPRRNVTWMFAAWTVTFFFIVGWAFSTEVWQLAVLMALLAGSSTVGMVIWGTLLHTQVDGRMLGRVSSLDWFVSLGLAPLSFALTGPAADLFGVEATLVGAGILGSVAFGLLFLVPGVRDPERQEERSAAYAGDLA